MNAEVHECSVTFRETEFVILLSYLVMSGTFGALYIDEDCCAVVYPLYY